MENFPKYIHNEDYRNQKDKLMLAQAMACHLLDITFKSMLID